MFNTKRKRAEADFKAAFLDRQQLIDDPALRQRVVDGIEQFLAVAPSADLHNDDLGGGFRHIYGRWSWKQDGELFVQKVVNPDGCDYEITIDTSDPFQGVRLFATSRPHSAAIVEWAPALGFGSADDLLDRLADAAHNCPPTA